MSSLASLGTNRPLKADSFHPTSVHPCWGSVTLDPSLTQALDYPTQLPGVLSKMQIPGPIPRVGDAVGLGGGMAIHTFPGHSTVTLVHANVGEPLT